MTSAAAQNDSWRQVVDRKRAQRAALIPSNWTLAPPPPPAVYSPAETLLSSGILTAAERDLTDTALHDLTATAARIAAREVTAADVVAAFCKRAAAAHSLANHLTEINFAGARARALELDDTLASTGRVVGPLHGVPVTIKDAMDLAGFASSEGLVRYANDSAPANAPLIQLLVDAGAVVIAKTNMPQTGLAADTDSILWGRTLNAHSSLFGAGGSTGGEGVAMATSSSLLGIGSDGAGSCRMPALANGVIGYKPSGYRFPAGSRNLPWASGRGALTVFGPVPSEGLFAHSVRDLRLVARLIAESSQARASSVALNTGRWRNATAPRRPRVGVWDIDSPDTYIQLSPPARRGFETAERRLRAAGLDVVRFAPPEMARVWALGKRFLPFQGVEGIAAALRDEPTTEIVRRTGAVSADMAFPSDVHVLYGLNDELVLQTTAFDASWNGETSGTKIGNGTNGTADLEKTDGNRPKPIDFLLSPTAGHTALPLDQWTDTGYTGLFNNVDRPALNLPLGMTADCAVDVRNASFVPLSEEDARLEALYDPDRYHGLPLSVQLSGRRNEDEELLAFAEMIHPILRGEDA